MENPVLKKLKFPAGKSCLIVNSPAEYAKLLVHLQVDAQPKKGVEYDFVQVFGKDKEELGKYLKAVLKAGKYDCLFWACYPKGGGKIKSDLKREVVWELVGEIGLQCVSQVAIDETWSALRARPPKRVGK